MDKRGKRVGENEILFRGVNESLRELGESSTPALEEADFVCECANTFCTERIRMPLSAYEQVRADPKRFLVIKGHEEADYERVVSEQGTYVVVEKLPGGPAGLAISDDPRS